MRGMRPYLSILGWTALFSLPFLFHPLEALAQVSRAGAGLVPCGVSSYYLTATECGLCDFATLVQNIINYLILLALPVSAALFAWAGILLFTAGDQTENRTKAKAIFKNVIVGLIIALSGYLIVQVTLNALVSTGSGGLFQGGFSFSFGQCVNDPTGTGARPRTKSISELFSGLASNGNNLGVQNNGTGNGAGNGGGGAGGNPVQVNAVGSNNSSQSITFSTTRSDTDLITTDQKVLNTYNSQIDAACSQPGITIPNCSAVVAAKITVESGGNPSASGGGALGVMQAQPGSPGSTCGVTDTACQITSGTKYLNTLYTQFGNNLPNALAGLSTGASTQPGTSVSGLNPALAPSVDCPGLYAYQCATNPGGLTVTRGNVANVCRILSLNNTGGC